MKRYRLLVISLAGLLLTLVGLLTFGNLNQNLVYYLTPTEAVAKRAEFPDGRRFQLGGFVREGSVARTPQGIEFTVASQSAGGGDEIHVIHNGAPAQLFRAGIGVVLEGSWQAAGFVSDSMIVKHDENYKPPKSEQNAGSDAR